MIELKHVLYAYQSEQMEFNFTVKQGEVITILGPSGAGKSTLLSLIAGFIEPTSGQIVLNGKDETDSSPANRPVSMLFQDNNLFSHLSVEQNLALGLSPSMKLDSEQKLLLMTIAERIGLTEYLQSYPEHLSGGQKQRVALGRCLMMRRPILLLDEPFSSLDPKLKKEMFTLLYEIQKEFNLTVLMVTHQLEDINEMNNRCLVIIEGKIAFDGGYDELKNNQQISAYLGLDV